MKYVTQKPRIWETVLSLFWKWVVFHISSCCDFGFLSLKKEYVLAHTEMPTTLEGAEAAIKKQEDFMTTMDANEEKINAVVETGRRLVSDGNINSDRIQEKVDSIDDRYSVPRFLRESGTLGLSSLRITGQTSLGLWV